MALDPMLLEILACPQDKGPLFYFADEDCLYNPRLRLSYAVRDDIPIMLVEEATAVTEDEHERLMAKAASSGLRPTFEPPAAAEPAAAEPAAAAHAEAPAAADPAAASDPPAS